MAGKGPSRRPEQIAEAIRGVVAEALLRGEVRDPRVTMVTLSGVDGSRDLSHATIRVVPHESGEAREAAIAGLQSAAGYLRRLVAASLTTRTVPELRFVLDRNFEHAQRIDQLLSEIRHDEEAS